MSGSEKRRRQRRPWPSWGRRTTLEPFMLRFRVAEGDWDSAAQSVARRLERADEALSPIVTDGWDSQVVRRVWTKECMLERMAASEGVRDAFWMTVRARRVAEGAGDCSASIREDSLAKVIA